MMSSLSPTAPLRSGPIALALESTDDDRLWSGILASQDVRTLHLGAIGGGCEVLAADPRLDKCCAMVIDAPRLLAEGIAAANLAAAMRARGPALFVRLPGRTGISRPEREWAKGVGIASLLPGSTVAAWQESIEPVLRRILQGVGREEIDSRRLDAHIRELVRMGVEPRPGPVKDLYAEAYRIETGGLDAMRIYEAMQGEGGVPVADRSFRGKTYRDCFVASEAIDWVASTTGTTRSLARSVCSFLWRAGRVHHVLRDAAFDDDYLFFRFAGRRAQLEGVDLLAMQAAMRGAGGLAVADRSYLGKTYARCFVGSECVDWMMRYCHVPFGSAEALGQHLLELGVFHHVVDQHGFIGANLYYRFRADEVR